MSMLCKPMWSFLLMYESHDIRHTGFSQVDGGQWDPREMGRHNNSPRAKQLSLQSLTAQKGTIAQEPQQLSLREPKQLGR